jgi:hypothetical protein
MDEVDPDGLISQTVNGGDGWMGWSQMQGQMAGWDPGSYDIYQKFSGTTGEGTYWQTVNVESAALNAAFTSTRGPMMGMGPAGMGGGRGSRTMFAAGGYGQSSVTTPEGAEAVAQLQEDGITVGKPGNPAASLEKAIQAAKDWLGKEVRAITNKNGDSVFMNKAGTRKLRFDIKNPSPHENPHAHIEELINGKWKGPRIYPRDVPPR